ncbi:MAG TPA: flagellar biosynthesis protein FlgE [Clostridiales bacterium UBA8960]|jgi:flagellar basal-body rod protein FlgG|nr:flagellar biosynthesis protein FlgE [Clostridiales bacterium UBA8960]
MIKGLYIAGTSMITNINKMDVISNNLANINTTGYKKDNVAVESFNARLFMRINGSNIPAETGVASVTQSQYGDAINASTDKGYFRIETPNGIHYGKSAHFFKDTDGYLRTIYKNIGGTLNNLAGNLVLGKNGPVYIGESDFTLDDKGNVSVDGAVVDNLIVQTGNNIVGTMSAGVRGYTLLTDHEQGQLQMTNNNFDLAIKGDGFFVVNNERGEFLTRNGAFTINGVGELVTFEGDRVMGLNGPIFIDSQNFSINAFGEVIQNGEITDKLQMVSFTNVSDVMKVGSSLYKEKAELTGEKVEFEGEIVQGFLEQSNSDAVTEMIQMIEMNRNYQNSQKVITTIDEMIGKAVTELGRI